ncbi:tRNA adenosine(34) deaminase TadA [Clostridium merdae]|uniref:tRNA adenosine(34) deaminase TadA n=1 Tax=Clostridium merdae TaxID=1958780 RepID=UPI000A2702A3|nr:tRNA adenosine(34) deaminase TadA [Clostridium merdae]
MRNAEQDEKMMHLALELAQIAAQEGEVPVGAVVAKGNEIIAVGRNRREQQKNALCHAEIEAINAACQALGGWRLWECDLYVTLEPCPMCTGAIINSRIARVVYGASDAKAGSCGSVVNLFELPYNHQPELVSGVLQEECGAVLTQFFQSLRDKRSKKKKEVVE